MVSVEKTAILQANQSAHCAEEVCAFRSPQSVRIVDTRTRGEKKEHQFDGVAAQVYLLCDAAQTALMLMDAPALRERASESTVIGILQWFVELGVMLREGKQYLSLAVIRNGHSGEWRPDSEQSS